MIILIIGSDQPDRELLRAVANLGREPQVVMTATAHTQPPPDLQRLAVEFSRHVDLVRALKPHPVTPGEPLALPAPRPPSLPRTRVGDGGHRRKERDYG
jgi:hypothetical protein